MQFNGINTATNTQKIASCLHQQGVEVVGRYYSCINTWKRLTRAEARQLAACQMKIISIWQESANAANYFTQQRGCTDGLGACHVAQAFGQPRQTPIYFAIDYDALPADRQRLRAYFYGVQQSFTDYACAHADHPYSIGVYGSTWVLGWCRAWGIVKYFMQAYPPGWAGGANTRDCNGIHVRQLSSNRTLCGISVDHLQLHPLSGAWIPRRTCCSPSGTML